MKTVTDCACSNIAGSLSGGENVSRLTADLRMEQVISLNQQMSASSSNKKRKLSVDPDSAPAVTEDEAEAPAKRLKLDVEEEEEGGETPRRGGGATRRQQDVKLKLEEKEKKEKEKGPGWYYELVPVKKPRFVVSHLCSIISISVFSPVVSSRRLFTS